MRNQLSRPLVVGDVVLVKSVGYNSRKNESVVECRVVKVARKYATAEPTNGQKWPSEYVVDKTDGWGKNEGYGASHRAWHPEDYEAEKARADVTREISLVLRSPSWMEKFTTEQLRYVAEILANPAIAS
jgi:hypothetical protein